VCSGNRRLELKKLFFRKKKKKKKKERERILTLITDRFLFCACWCLAQLLLSSLVSKTTTACVFPTASCVAIQTTAVCAMSAPNAESLHLLKCFDAESPEEAVQSFLPKRRPFKRRLSLQQLFLRQLCLLQLFLSQLFLQRPFK
jgi:hypothetical protein